MKKGHMMMTLTLTLIGASVAWAQTDQNPPAAPPPAPAFGQETPAAARSVSENPPISAIDQPGLEPHAAPESFLLPGLHFSESADSNPGDTLGGSSFGAVTRGLGSLTLQKLWKNYAVAMDYIGGVVYDSGGVGLEQLQQFDMDNRINWKRGQLAIRDSVSYLPEGTFGFSAYGGSGAYDSGLGSLGSGMLGSAAFGGQASSFTGGNGAAPVEFGTGGYRREPDAQVIGYARGGVRGSPFLRGPQRELSLWRLDAGERFLRGQFRSNSASRL